ncbi:hypothetical protein [Enterovibrio norvegicus]|uniref:hypothetical protein n=1 Tax=Enterovibrio norvegicus TaxID=188144 RepID=UPI00352F84B9
MMVNSSDIDVASTALTMTEVAMHSVGRCLLVMTTDKESMYRVAKYDGDHIALFVYNNSRGSEHYGYCFHVDEQGAVHFQTEMDEMHEGTLASAFKHVTGEELDQNPSILEALKSFNLIKL